MEHLKSFIILLLITCILSSCSSNSPIQESDYQKGFTESLGSKIAQADDGYYLLAENFLYFFKNDLSKGTIVCGKPQCLHEKERPENIPSCDAYLYQPRGIQFYGGNLYTLASDGNSKTHGTAIYQISRDGSEKTKLCELGEFAHSFCTHRGNFYVYEKIYAEDNDKVKLTISQIPIVKPSSKKTLYETETVPEADINYLICYEDKCYFRLFNLSALTVTNYQIDLQTETVSQPVDNEAGSFFIDKKGIFYSISSDVDRDAETWKHDYYHCDFKKENTKLLTEEDFSALKFNATLIGIDSNFVYFNDIDYGANEIPADQHVLSIYDYDGNLKGTLKNGQYELETNYLPGSEEYFFVIERQRREDSLEYVYYYIDKKNFQGGQLKATEFFRYDVSEMSPSVLYKISN